MCRYAVLRSESQTKVPSDTTMVGMSEEYVVGIRFPDSIRLACSKYDMPGFRPRRSQHWFGHFNACHQPENRKHLVQDSFFIRHLRFFLFPAAAPIAKLGPRDVEAFSF